MFAVSFLQLRYTTFLSQEREEALNVREAEIERRERAVRDRERELAWQRSGIPSHMVALPRAVRI